MALYITFNKTLKIDFAERSPPNFTYNIKHI